MPNEGLSTKPGWDPIHDVLRQASVTELDVFFSPRRVALIGASETPGSVGRMVLNNLLTSSFDGSVYPVNPNRPSVLGVPAFSSVGAVPEPIDLAVIATPATTVPGIVSQCVAAGVRGTVILSAGFRETGAAGAALEREVLREARQNGLRIIGPNCLGVMSPLSGLNATFAQGMAKPGSVAFLSQSGALLTAVLDRALREQVGFSALVSLGSMLDVGWGDLIDYLGNDPRTQSIVLYMESVGSAEDAGAFLSAARAVALSKPIIVLKAGRTAFGAKAAASHTGALTGSDAVLDAAFRRAGVLRVETMADAFALTETLAMQPLPRGNRLTIVTNAGGPGVLATDTLIAGGGTMATLGEQTKEALDGFLPAAWSQANPVDVLGDAPPDRYAQTLERVMPEPASDGLLVILTPQAMTDPTLTAEKLLPYAHVSAEKPVLASWMGGAAVLAGEQILAHAGIPTFAYPDQAARVFNALWRYARDLRTLYETPTSDVLTSYTADRDPKEAEAGSLLARIRASGRTLLTEAEAKQVLAGYGIPTVPTSIAATADEAARCAVQLGFPVVLKLHSETVTHKSDVNGVHLSLRDAEEVRRAFAAIREGVAARPGGSPADFLGVTVQPMLVRNGYELILGSSPDPQFGPVLLFGLGGQLVEVFRDQELALPPLTTTLARRFMERTQVWTALQGVRGRAAVDLAGLENILVRFARLVTEQPAIAEIDINPLLASPKGITALDARIVVYPQTVADDALPRPAIRPYPAQYISQARLRNGNPVLLRPILPEDETRLRALHHALSEKSVTARYSQSLSADERAAHERLVRICQCDYARDLPLVAVRGDQILGIARLNRLWDGSSGGTRHATFSLLVADASQNKGLGTMLLRRLIDIARAENITLLFADVLAQNAAVRRVCKRLGFSDTAAQGTPPVVTVSLVP